MGRRYRKNDWWDFMIVIEQELERDSSYNTFYNIADELKWRFVESISEGANFKIIKKMKEIRDIYHKNCKDRNQLSATEQQEIEALFDFVAP